MKKFLISAVLGAAMLVPALAKAEVAFTSDSMIVRAGPGHDYPRIDRLPPNMRVRLYGCIDRFDWCDVSFGGIRGWVDGERLFVPYQGRRVRVIEYGPRLSLPLVSFGFDSYWDEHYRRHGFYRERDHWRSFRDRDHDGVPNRFDRDRDGDGVPNRFDRQPNNPRRD